MIFYLSLQLEVIQACSVPNRPFGAYAVAGAWPSVQCSSSEVTGGKRYTGTGARFVRMEGEVVMCSSSSQNVE